MSYGFRRRRAAEPARQGAAHRYRVRVRMRLRMRLQIRVRVKVRVTCQQSPRVKEQLIGGNPSPVQSLIRVRGLVERSEFGSESHFVVGLAAPATPFYMH
jgi:hypothetical protein